MSLKTSTRTLLLIIPSPKAAWPIRLCWNTKGQKHPRFWVVRVTVRGFYHPTIDTITSDATDSGKAHCRRTASIQILLSPDDAFGRKERWRPGRVGNIVPGLLETPGRKLIHLYGI